MMLFKDKVVKKASENASTVVKANHTVFELRRNAIQKRLSVMPTYQVYYLKASASQERGYKRIIAGLIESKERNGAIANAHVLTLPKAGYTVEVSSQPLTVHDIEFHLKKGVSYLIKEVL
jgi:hypothetical protein